MKLTDCQILSPSINASDELCFKLKLKKEDWNEQLKALIYLSYNEWKTLDLEIVGLQDQPEDVMRKLRGDLGSLMSVYCSQAHIDSKEELKRLYERNNVSSRTDLTRSQLDDELARYRAWVEYNS